MDTLAIHLLDSSLESFHMFSVDTSGSPKFKKKSYLLITALTEEFRCIWFVNVLLILFRNNVISFELRIIRRFSIKRDFFS